MAIYIVVTVLVVLVLESVHIYLDRKKYGHLSPDEKIVAKSRDKAEEHAHRRDIRSVKRIVDDVLYDCWTAKCLAVTEDDELIYDTNMFGAKRSCGMLVAEKSLWQKTSGEYFLLYKTRFSTRIFPYTEDDAKTFINKRFGPIIYMSMFGPVPE